MGAPFVDAATVDIAPGALQELSGRYFLVSEGRQGQQVELVLKNGHLCVGDARLRPVGGGAFVMQGSLLRIEFEQDCSPLQLRLFMSGEGSGVLWQRLAV